ncbi:GAF domain-containing protein [Epibacterium sp. SM1979]|uniref:GAF domain-containing protein n=1 Tax=Tritonibacter litoralis TaxID=2662264 RepID=A0A843YD58_9RHOB|nr:sigma-54-dependent Fis family transcriptional regulator [Tritonibacter litoralis]MQQ07798.1 GAF domain-containing protein [Tritonibacter litoralis]
MQTRQHVEEIERVLDGAPTGRDTFVSASWRRCVELYGMDPLRSDPAHIVTETELKAHRKQAEWMIAAARSGLQSLFRQVAGQNYVLLLTDAQGVCVDFFGDDLFLDDLRGAGLYLGSNWSEELAGTCGVGACIVTEEPVTVHQSDHFGNAHTTLSCTAAPIFDSLGKLTAVLDISLLRSPAAKSSQNLAMNLVTNAARRVEMANLMAESRRDWVLRLSSSPEFLDVDPEAAVRLDGSGKVIGYTRDARKLFPDGAPILGRRIDEVMGVSVDDLPDLMRNRPTEERIVEMGDGGALFGHAIAPESPRRALSPMAPQKPLGGVLAGLAGGDPGMGRLLEKAEKLSRTQVPLLITGETGCGKCRLARAIHMAGQTAGFVTVNCAGLTSDGLRAACDKTTGATTLLLRRVENMTEEAAHSLASLLDERSDIRPLSTCCLDPADLDLPSSLFHRLCGTVLAMPPLRQRQDLSWLIDRLLRRRAPDEIRLSPSARVNLLGRSWPGNLRELEHVLDVTLALSDGSVIDLPDLPAPIESATRGEESLEETLEACDWNMSQAARRLGVNRSTILRRIRKSGLKPPS